MDSAGGHIGSISTTEAPIRRTLGALDVLQLPATKMRERYVLGDKRRRGVHRAETLALPRGLRAHCFGGTEVEGLLIAVVA